MRVSDLFQQVPLGIMLDLTVGKLIGVYGFSVAAIKMEIAQIPEEANFQHMFGMAALCGVSFTMSLFICGLAFEHVGGDAAT